MEFNQNKELLSNTLALNVALQTIKERCVHLQKRLYALESENSRLRLNNVNNDKTNESRNSDNSLISELENMRAKNAELTLQNSQLTENLSMISTENRKLWRRLSHLTKENGASDNEPMKGSEEIEEPVTRQHANLIRSKTFTQNSPHQLLKEKLAGSQIGPTDDDLEDISLINDCGFAADKMVDGIEGENCDVDTKSCTEGLMSIKKEILRQNNELKVAISNWRKSKNSAVASEAVCSCKSKTNDSSKKPTMVDKSLETDRDLTLEFEMDHDAPNNNVNNFDLTGNKHENILDDLLEQKKAADKFDKICPMCGKFYTQDILFDEFQEHVESHFRDSDSDIEQLSLDHNFELVSHSVGNF